ncbi:MAG: cysteine hydrolase [Caldilineaceae bacterium]|nr:cysteine hydrolase [Caldilineaceae bacterium]
MNFPVNPARMALINCTLQNRFVEDPTYNRLALLERINHFAAVCRAAGILVIHTRHVVRVDGSNTGVLGEIYPPMNDVLNSDAPGAALHPRLVVDAQDIILDIPRYGAFHGTDLELILRPRGIDALIVTGIATNVGPETTVREAVARDFRVFLLSDGTSAQALGGLTSEEAQRASLATLGVLFAQVLTIEEMIGKIQGTGHAAGG